jgi:hypothetical protein
MEYCGFVCAKEVIRRGLFHYTVSGFHLVSLVAWTSPYIRADELRTLCILKQMVLCLY